MERRPTPRVLICDDDPVLRDVLERLATDCGHRVVAHAANAADALDAVRTQHVDVVVLDLALQVGSGEEVLLRVEAEHPEVDVVVFTAFPEDPDALRAAGALAVIEKPDFEALEAWMSARTRVPEAQPGPGAERRRPAQPAPALPDPGPASPSGFEPWSGLRGAVDRLWPGDTVMTLDLLEVRRLSAIGDAIHLLDHRLALARMVAPTLRALDRISVTPTGVVVCLLVAGHPEAPAAVFDRLETGWDRHGLDGTPIGAFSRVRPDEHPAAALDRTLELIADPGTSAAHPLRLG